MQTTYLIIRFSSLGDIILTSPTVLNLRLAEPDCKIIYLTKQRFKDVVAMLPGVDETLCLPDNGTALDLYNLILELDRKRIDVIIDLHGNIRSALVRKIVRPNRVVVYPKRRQERWRAVKFKDFGEEYPHTIDLYNDVLAQLGYPVPAIRPQLSLTPGQANTVSVENTNKPLIIIAPGAAHANKRWPNERFVETAESIHRESGVKIIWVVTSNDAEAINTKPAIDDNHFEMLIDYPIPELAQLIAQATLTIANDSGIAHLSSSVGTPTLALFGPTHPVLGFSPRGINDRILQVDEFCRPCSLHGGKPCYREERFCFNRISSSIVVDEATEMLRKSIEAAPALFVDRDGTLIENRHYLADPEGVEFIPGSIDALKAAQAEGYRIVVLSNQSGVARGIMASDDVERVNNRIDQLCRESGLTIDRFYYCPHHPTEGTDPVFTHPCDCRKPAAGMAEQAAQELNLDLGRSVVIGDSPVDINLGRVIGSAACLVKTGHGAAIQTDWNGLGSNPVYANLAEAVKAILSCELP